MTRASRRPATFLATGLIALCGLAGCQKTAAVDALALAPTPDPKQQECLARAMYFESNRSSQQGMLAVGSVVMNRVDSGEYGTSPCEVVAQPRQFAPGVMTRTMSAGKDLAMSVAGDVLAGARHPEVGEKAMFFHTAGLTFPYGNMNYVAIAGGNAFYERLSREERDRPMTTQADIRNAYAAEKKEKTAAGQAIAATIVPTQKPEEQAAAPAASQTAPAASSAPAAIYSAASVPVPKPSTAPAATPPIASATAQ